MNKQYLGGLVGSTLIVALGLMLGRVSGLLRELILASTFGVSQAADVAILVLTIPDLIANLLIGGALSVALIPEFRRLGQPSGAGLFVQASIVAGFGFSAIACVGAFFSQELVLAFAPGMDMRALNQTASLVSLSLWLLPLTALAGVTSAYLHAHQQFAVASLGTLLYNLSVIAGLALIALGLGGLRMLCVFAILGGMVRWVSQLSVLPGRILLSAVSARRHIDRPLIKRFVQASVAGGLLLVLPVAARALASYSGEGAIASFNYALKLTEFALGVTVTVLSVTIFPHLAQGYVEQDEARFRRLLKHGIWWMTMLALSTAIPLMWFARYFVELAYGWGQISMIALDEIGMLMLIGLIGLPLQGLSSLLAAASNARRDAFGPLVASVVALMVFLPLGLFLHASAGLSGIMISLVISYLVAMLLQSILLKRHHGLSVASYVLSGSLLRPALLIAAIGSLTGVTAIYLVDSMVAGVLLAGVSAALGLGASVSVDETRRAKVITWLKKKTA